jgi:hypothetical protein
VNRADRLRLLAVAEAVAAQLREGLRAEALETFESEGLAVSWAADGISAVSSRTHDAVEVADEDELMSWLLLNKPDWVHVVVVPHNPKQVRDWLATLAGDPDLGKVPGVVLRKGGQFKSLSITVDPGVKRDLSALAKDALEGGGIPDDLAAVFARRELPAG